MPSLIFQPAPTAAAVSPNRADVVCFIGFVTRRATPLPLELQDWLRREGWRAPDSEIADADALLNTPVPVESFAAFDKLFAWEKRPTANGVFAHPAWLGVAVRAFFRQGGARCLIARVGDPWAYAPVPANETVVEKTARETRQRERLELLLPGFAGGAVPLPNDRSSWRGLGALLGLDEAAFVCLPDLPEIIADAALEPAGLPPLPVGSEIFVECSPTIPLPADEIRRISQAPACTDTGFGKWFQAARFATRFVRARRRDAQLLLATPLAAEGTRADMMKVLASPRGRRGLTGSIDDSTGIASAFLQLAFPWLLTSRSEALPGGIEPPDGTLAGVIAYSVAARGVYRSVGREPLRGVQNFFPEISQREMQLAASAQATPTLIQRVSLLGQSPTGPRVLSDVTTSLSEAHRPACVGRLTAAILRAAKNLGAPLVFEPSGPDLWRSLENRLTELLAGFFAAGAFSGATRAEAYRVRCDATTTTQNDLDNGRVLVEVRFAPAHPIGLITVVLALRDGDVSVAGGAA